MKTVRYTVTMGMTLFLMGCPVRSLFPLFAEKDVVFNLGLVGTWSETDKKVTYFFQKEEGKNYVAIVCDEKGDTSQYTAQLGQLSKFWFLDSYPGKDASDYQMIPTHVISRMWLNGDTLRFASLESDYVKKLIETGKITIPHVSLKEDIILTASSDELQQLVLRLAEDDQAFPKPTILIRVK